MDINTDQLPDITVHSTYVNVQRMAKDGFFIRVSATGESSHHRKATAREMGIVDGSTRSKIRRGRIATLPDNKLQSIVIQARQLLDAYSVDLDLGVPLHGTRFVHKKAFMDFYNQITALIAAYESELEQVIDALPDFLEQITDDARQMASEAWHSLPFDDHPDGVTLGGKLYTPQMAADYSSDVIRHARESVPTADTLHEKMSLQWYVSALHLSSETQAAIAADKLARNQIAAADQEYSQMQQIVHDRLMAQMAAVTSTPQEQYESQIRLKIAERAATSLQTIQKGDKVHHKTATAIQTMINDFRTLNDNDQQMAPLADKLEAYLQGDVLPVGQICTTLNDMITLANKRAATLAERNQAGLRISMLKSIE